MLKFTLPSDKRKHNVFGIYLDRWQKAGQIETKTYDGDFVWIGEQGDTLFWPWPQTSHTIVDTRHNSLEVDARAWVYANTLPDADARGDRPVFPSFFWPRAPRIIEARHETYVDWNDRHLISIFIGKIQNAVQAQYRSLDYSNAIEIYDIFRNLPRNVYPYSQTEFYDLLGAARFSLSLRGFGAKCFREVESLALGTVLLVNDDVDTGGYHAPLIEGTHYFRYETEEDLRRVQRDCDEATWRRMSQASREWYRENASADGALNTLEQVVQKIAQTAR